ncbi:MAG: hypothetical protein KIS72_04150, partial [Luteimonas sp.]|nr:hypothetical protein [Luteimonas sp.]
VTRRLPAQFAGMVHARATAAVVTAMPPRPAFVISAEPVVLPTLSTVGGLSATLTSGAALRAVRLRPGGELPDLPEPEEPEPGPVRPPPPPRFDSADAKAFREAAARHLARVNPPLPLVFTAVAQRAVLDPAALRGQVRALLDPAPPMARRMAATIRIAGPQAPRAIGPLGGAPAFAQPMSEALAALSQDWLLPGLDKVPPDSVAMLEPNARFIESYMLGLNVEMGRELLWRDFVVSDPRATFFRRFWRTVRAGSEGDIAPIAQWADRPLGGNGAAGGVRQVVLLVRSGLFRRYPGASVYAVPAVAVGSGRRPGEQGAELQPLFRGALQPDVSFFGFDLDPAIASGDPGWYFVIQQQPTEPRFGFDVDIDFGALTHVPLASPPAGHALPAGTIWKFNAAHMAMITQQQPVRVAIHASELITPAEPS